MKEQIFKERVLIALSAVGQIVTCAKGDMSFSDYLFTSWNKQGEFSVYNFTFDAKDVKEIKISDEINIILYE